MNNRMPQLQRQAQHFWVGLGCQRGTSRKLIETAIGQVCKENQLNQSAIAGLATIDNKASEVGLVEFCQIRNFYLKTFPAEILRQVCVPNPAEITNKAMGTPSVAEAAAMLAAANIEWQSTIVSQIEENEEKFSTRGSLLGEKEQGEKTPAPCRGAERNMGLSPPLLLSGSRTLREASATGGVESPFEPSPLLPAPCPFSSSSTHQSLQLDAHSSNLTPSFTDWGVRCLVPKQIFRLPGEPGTVTIAVATLIPQL